MKETGIWCPRDERGRQRGRKLAAKSHIMVALIVLHVGREKRHGRAAGVFPPMRCGACLARDFARLVHDTDPATSASDAGRSDAGAAASNSARSGLTRYGLAPSHRRACVQAGKGGGRNMCLKQMVCCLRPYRRTSRLGNVSQCRPAGKNRDGGACHRILGHLDGDARENYRTLGRESISATRPRNTCPCNQPAWGGKGIRQSEIPCGPPSRRRCGRSRPFRRACCSVSTTPS
jgi:hypothetical protein